MITNTGKAILSKYLIGQTTSYASYIALGVGAEPLNSTQDHGDYSAKEALDFEAIRVPISSRGYVYDESGLENIVFSAELPTSERYQFTEIGVYSGKANAAAGPLDSKIVYTFSDSEGWELHTATDAPAVEDPVGAIATEDVIDPEDSFPKAFRVNSNNELFNNPERRARHEEARFLAKSIFCRSDLSYLEESGGVLSPREPVEGDPDFGSYYKEHLHLTGITVPFSRNSANDRISLAFSVLDKDPAQADDIAELRILVQFASGETDENSAKFNAIVSSGFASNRYFVVSKNIGELTTSPEFTWDTVDRAKIYVSAFDSSGNLLDNYYVALDGLRLDNTTTLNPLYGLTGYTVVRNSDGSPVVKRANSSNIVEFRFAVDVEAFGGS